jgi:threonine synthase
MKYQSTRNSKIQLSSMEAIKQGISTESGLFVPESIPALQADQLKNLISADYRQRAMEILQMYLTDYSREDLQQCTENAYGSDNFSSEEIAPVVSLDDGLHILELWHGPTCAFKDMALQILPHFMTAAIRHTGEKKDIVILAATSGDTGKAALEGFKDVPGTRIMVFYPQQGVSEMQKLQMITQQGKNVRVAAVEGNFDDTQTGVKRIFNDPEMKEILGSHGCRFSSANSINWGRLVPQIVYYISSYLDLIKKGKITLGQAVNFVVPTGNFGNILAGYYAKRMGLPIHRLICASNDNKVLTDFIRTGVYNRKREFYKTISPSMDILMSSNLERLLYELTDHDDLRVAQWMKELSETGQYKLSGNTLKRLQSLIWSGYATVEQTKDAIRDTYEKTGYTLDPHTAVGKWVYDNYRRETGDTTETVLVSTASPFKFPGDVLEAISPEAAHSTDTQLLEQLAEISSYPIPKPLQGLSEKPVLHKGICTRSGMKDEVISFIKGER